MEAHDSLLSDATDGVASQTSDIYDAVISDLKTFAAIVGNVRARVALTNPALDLLETLIVIQDRFAVASHELVVALHADDIETLRRLFIGAFREVQIIETLSLSTNFSSYQIQAELLLAEIARKLQQAIEISS